MLVISGEAQRAAENHSHSQVVPVTDNPTISMDIDNSVILCYAAQSCVLYKTGLVSYIRLVLCLI